MFFNSLLVLFGELRKFEAIVGTFLVLGAVWLSTFVFVYRAGTFDRVVAVHYVQDVLGKQLSDRTLFFVGFHRVREIL